MSISFGNVISRCTSTSLKRNNIEVVDYLLAIIKYVNRPKSASVSDIDMDIADILGKKYCIDIGQRY